MTGQLPGDAVTAATMRAADEAYFAATHKRALRRGLLAALEAAAPAIAARPAADELERIRQLAIEHNARCHHADGSGGSFADLIGEAP